MGYPRMQVLASSSSLRTDVKGYNVPAIVSRLSLMSPDIIFLTEKDDMAGELGTAMRNHLNSKIIDCSQDPAYVVLLFSLIGLFGALMVSSRKHDGGIIMIVIGVAGLIALASPWFAVPFILLIIAGAIALL